MVIGVVSAIGLIILSPNVWPGAATDTGTPLPFTLANPGIISIPLGFLGCILGTVLSSERAAERSFSELFVRSETGLGRREGAPGPLGFAARNDPEARSNMADGATLDQELGTAARAGVLPAPGRVPGGGGRLGPVDLRRADADPEGFWAEQAEALHWFEKWDQVLDWSNPPFAKWFVGGKLNVSYNCLDRHVEAGLGDRVAFHWRGEEGEERDITYAELHARRAALRERAARTAASAPATSSGSSCR